MDMFDDLRGISTVHDGATRETKHARDERGGQIQLEKWAIYE